MAGDVPLAAGVVDVLPAAGVVDVVPEAAGVVDAVPLAAGDVVEEVPLEEEVPESPPPQPANISAPNIPTNSIRCICQTPRLVGLEEPRSPYKIEGGTKTVCLSDNTASNPAI
jgi:hypothetical protein